MTTHQTRKPAQGPLVVFLPGLGAVATTFVAGVELARRGMSPPVGSLTQLESLRLGKRTEDRNVPIKELAKLQNTLRFMAGEDLITNLGLDYYGIGTESGGSANG